MTWETTDVAAYMTGGGIVYTDLCGCATNSNNYHTYMDVVRIKLTLN